MTSARTGMVKTDKGQQTRAAILETALDMFRERGYEQTTMRAIADKAGLSVAKSADACGAGRQVSTISNSPNQDAACAPGFEGGSVVPVSPIAPESAMPVARRSIASTR